MIGPRLKQLPSGLLLSASVLLAGCLHNQEQAGRTSAIPAIGSDPACTIPQLEWTMCEEPCDPKLAIQAVKRLEQAAALEKKLFEASRFDELGAATREALSRPPFHEVRAPEDAAREAQELRELLCALRAGALPDPQARAAFEEIEDSLKSLRVRYTATPAPVDVPPVVEQPGMLR